MSPADIRVVLFDIGGVLVEPSGVDTMLRWMEYRVSAEEMWRMWLTSENVRAFETGRKSAEDFADALVSDFGLTVGPDEFLNELPRWSTTLFPGALELLQRLPSHYTRATLCNTNPIHWVELMKTPLKDAFPRHFASHLIGRIKPDAEAFQHVLDELNCGPECVLFLDDNELNVRGARTLGMNAVRVKGPGEAERALVDYGVLVSTAGS